MFNTYIGIGASNIVWTNFSIDDLINLNTISKKPKFVKKYMNFNKIASNAVKKYNSDVKLKKFPSIKFTYN